MKIGRYTGLGYSRRTPVPEKPPAAPVLKKKALLIGITYKDSETYTPLKGPHSDVLRMRELLVEQYGYALTDIVTLLDSGEGVQPTRVNILRAIGDLVRGARKGDRFFFHYCGHTIQMENRSNSEEDGMDECLVPADGDEHKIMDNELRRHLVDALPVGSSLVAVFDSCHSASLLDLAHFRCNRVYVPWVSKGRRRSDELWNSNVRRYALPLLPLSPSGSPGVSRTNTHANAAAAAAPLPKLPSTGGKDKDKTARRATRRATREMRELAQLLEARELAQLVEERADLAQLAEGRDLPELVSTRPNSPVARSPLGEASPIVTTRRIYEASRTSPRHVRAWRTEVDALAVGGGSATNVSREGTGEMVEPQPQPRAETEVQGEREKEKQRRRRKRASLPMLGSLSLGSASFSRSGSGHKENKEKEKAKGTEGESGEGDGVLRRTAVVRARAVSVAVGKENARPAPEPEKELRPDGRERGGGRPVSWLEEEADADAGARACDSPEPVWACQGNCRDPGHGHEANDKAEVISLASCKDSQLSWEDGNGGSMTRELVRILERDPHPTLRALVTGVSHALHRMSLERHVETRRYKRDVKKYAAFLARMKEHAHLHPPVDDSSSATVADSDSVAPRTPDPASATSPSPFLNVKRKTKPKAPQAKAKSEGFVDAPVYDMDNFQDPQVASHHPLDMERPFTI
ncbi:caspase domain-containing protein [Mycena galericulata]|nr:caspase domain-containing protein [Mycena galericulata]KAJ7469870.1 caspase domain-containing protein [Mycena galericulata]